MYGIVYHVMNLYLNNVGTRMRFEKFLTYKVARDLIFAITRIYTKRIATPSLQGTYLLISYRASDNKLRKL